MMKAFVVVSVLLAVAHALPSTTSSVSDSTVSSYDAAADAKDTVAVLLQEGKDEGACASLAAASIKEVEDSVESAQKILASLDTGADCPKEGQPAVHQAQTALDNAKQAATDANTAAATAASAPVKFNPIPFSGLKEGNCGTFFSDPVYVAAKNAAKAAQEAATKAAGVVTAAEAALDAAQKAQQEAVAKCQNDVRCAYDKAWEAANANNDSNEKTYTKGKHMKCVLDGTPPASCTVGAIPKVTAITLADGVEAQCEAEHTSQKVTCTMTMDNAVTDVLYNGKHIQHMTGQMGNWNANKIFTFDSVANGVLLVAGYDSEGGNSGHCKTGGFAIQCQSDDSFWGSFTSASSAIQAAGGQNSHGGFNGPFNPWGTPCTSTSGFSLPANKSLKKLWAPNGERWAKFQMGPSFQ